MKIENELMQVVGVKNISFFEDMKKHTTLKIGGKAKIFLTPNNVEQIINIVKICEKYKMDYCVIGLGSKLLVLDEGINKVVICLTHKFSGIEKIDNTTLKVLSGTSLNKLCKFCLNEELSGSENLFLIPATVGGAIHNNAGAYSFSIADIVESVVVLEDGNIKEYKRKDCAFEYRNSIFYNRPHCIILCATLKFKKGNKQQIQNKFVEILNSRTKTQPIDKRTCGSVFKRDGNIIPAKLIDELNLKGYSVGDACISTKHSGFIENCGNATAKDVLNLIDFICKKVYNKYDVELKKEIIVLGEEK